MRVWSSPSRNGKSSTVSIFDGTDELAKTTPRRFEIKGEINSLILANPGGIAQGKDVFGIADGEIFTMRRVGNRNTSINKIELPFRAADIAVGEFIRDREVRAEIAVLKRRRQCFVSDTRHARHATVYDRRRS